MADPDDAAAHQAIAAALGAQPYMVRGAPERIDALLAEIWPEATRPALRWLAGARAGDAEAYMQYIEYIGDLLGSRPAYPAAGEGLAEQVRQGCELVLLWEPGPQVIEQVLASAGDARPALLAVRRPRLPLRKVLLIAGGEAAEDAALWWTIRLARPSGAAVTVLAVAPGIDRRAAYPKTHPETHPENSLSALLAADTALGRQMRRVARRLLNWEIDGKLRLREGPLEQEVQLEAAAEDYDLIVAASQAPGELPGSLLSRAGRPVLMAAVSAISKGDHDGKDTTRTNGAQFPVHPGAAGHGLRPGGHAKPGWG